MYTSVTTRQTVWLVKIKIIHTAVFNFFKVFSTNLQHYYKVQHHKFISTHQGTFSFLRIGVFYSWKLRVWNHLQTVELKRLRHEKIRDERVTSKIKHGLLLSIANGMISTLSIKLFQLPQTNVYSYY